MAAFSLTTLVLLMVVASNIFCGGNVVSAQYCGGSPSDLATQCFQFVKGAWPKSPPSKACCTELKKFDVKCGCNLITKDIAGMVNIFEAAAVANYCGIHLPAAGTTCGAITIPCSGEGLDC